LINLALMLAMGVGFAKYNGGATTFFIFAAACGPFVVDTEADGVKVLVAVEAAAVATWWFFHLNWGFLVFGCALSLIVGASDIHFAHRNRTNRKLIRAQEEIEHLAKVAERDPQRAGNEIREVEQISRQALSEVRDAIRGYRSQGLAAELTQAKSTLQTAGVAVKCEAARMELPALHESVLSMAVREAVTNVVRHAQAQSCTLQLGQQNGSCRLQIEDDGRGGSLLEGNGLRGMRERVEMLGGTLLRESHAGTRLIITLPLNQVASQ
jgi:two-component system sensor histidine kinase DesK